MKKRFLSTLLALCMVLTLFPSDALAAEVANPAGTIPEGTQGDPADTVFQIGNDTDIPDLNREIIPYSGEETVTCTLDNRAELTVTVTGIITGGSPGSDGAINILEEIPIEGSDSGETIVVTSIGDSAFYWCSGLTSITLPDSITSIGDAAFEYCTELTSITISNNVTSIGAGAFRDCSRLTRITIPDSVTRIGDAAFSGCSSLADITIGPDNQAYTMLDKMLFSKDKSSIIFCSNWKSGAITLPDSVTRIGAETFRYCSGLTSITLPDSVTSIGDAAFYLCSSLTSITLPNSVTSIGDAAFEYCSSLTSITLPDSVTKIGDWVFCWCSSLTSITLPDSITSIGAQAFFDCSGLTSIIIPNSVTSIGYGAFDHCSRLASITIPDSVASIGAGTFSGCIGLTSITIPDSVTSIGDYAFSGCSGLTSITLPDSVTSIGDYAFQDCSGLTSITLPDSVTSIGYGAFDHVNSDFVLYCSSGSYAEAYAKAENLNYQLIAMSGRTLSVFVLDENGTVLSEGVAVTWYDENENSVGTGAALYGADPEKSYSIAVTLDGSLAASYEQPERQTIAPTDAASREIQLVKKAVTKTLTLFGQVNGQASTPLSGATVTVTPAEGDAMATITAADGTFAVSVPCGVVSIAIQKDGYYSKSETLNLTDETRNSYDAGIYILIPVRVITSRLTLSVTQQRAAEEQAMAVEMPLSSLENLEIMLTGSGGRPITDFDAQGLILLFQPGAVSANEQISITLKDPSGAYRAASATVTLDGDCLGTAELTMVQKGSFVLGGVSGPDANLLVFDGAGNCIQTSAAVPGLASGVMEPGTYQVVLLQKSELLGGVPTLSYLDTFGLMAGTDYLLRQITVADGEITQLDNCVVPTLDERRISYTIAESTSVTSSKPSGIAVGELLIVRAAYEMDITKDVSVDNLHIVLPAGVSLLDVSILIDGITAPYTYDQTTREVCVNMNGRDKAVVWLCCTPVKSGSYSIGAFLKLTNGSSQPIGAAVVLAEDARLNVPERTGKSEGLTASGKTRPDSTVTLYDNNIEVGRTTANATGSWSMSFGLVQPVYSYSYHNIHAVMTGSNLTEPITTESALVTYDKRLNVELEKITMYNTGESHAQKATVFDFMNSTSTITPYYRIFPSLYPTFTFKAEFSGDASKLEKVYVVTTNSVGDETYVKTKYDAASDAWVGTHNYTSFSAAPVAVTAAYSFGDDGETFVDEDKYEDIRAGIIEFGEEFSTAMEPILSEVIGVDNVLIGEDSLSASLICRTNKEEYGSIGSYQLKAEPLRDEITAETLTRDGFVAVANDGHLFASLSCTETMLILIYADLNDRTSVTVTIQLNTPMSRAGGFDSRSDEAINVVGEVIQSASFVDNINSLLEPAWGYISELVKEFPLPDWPQIPDKISNAIGYAGIVADAWDVTKTNKEWSRELSGNIQTLMDNRGYIVSLMGERCSDGQLRIPDKSRPSLLEMLNAIDLQVNDYNANGWNIIRRAGVGVSIANLFTIPASALSGTGEMGAAAKTAVAKVLAGTSITSYLAGLKTDPVGKWLDSTFEELNHQYYDLMIAVKASYRDCGGEPSASDLPISMQQSSSQPSPRPVTYITDPSGYVYEAVPSNRLFGVTAVISSEAGGTWNAEDYDQINPQTTGTDGGFYWDVPRGNWKVTLTKDGYASTDTSGVPSAVNGWLPVPPPQLDINVGMVSTDIPTVKSAVAYTNQVELVFSQYMNISSVQSAVSLTRNGTAVSDLTVRTLDAEYDAAGENQYATRFAIVPNDGDLSGSLTVSVGSGAKNYAGKPLAAAYTSPAMTAGIQPTGISGPDSVSTALHGTADVSLILQPGIAGQTLTIESLSPALVHVGVSEVTTGMDGRASIRISGELPGSGQIRITEPVSGLNKTITVFIEVDGTVTPQPEKPAQVKAALEDGAALNSGMTLPAGSKIRLWTDTPDAVIRYTLNDTCPCLEEALVYSEPVEIAGDTVLRAAAWKDGVYSDTIRLELSVKSPDTPVIPDRPDVPSTPSVPDMPIIPSTSGTSNRSDESDDIWGTSHKITVSSVSGGNVTVSPQAAAPGRTVTISTIPDEGYKLSSLAVIDSNGKSLTLTDKGDGKYTFTMPDDKVTVDAAFQPVQVSETPWSNPFTDITEGAWYYEAVRFVQKNGLMSGYGNGAFAPNANLSRAMLAQILHNREGEPSVSIGNAFMDISANDWYSNAVTWAAAKGIVCGYGNGLFGPNDDITREQLAVMLWRYAGSPVATNKELSFTDAGMVSGYALEALRWAVENGILNGYGDGRLNPDGLATRAQVAQMLKNYLEK